MNKVESLTLSQTQIVLFVESTPSNPTYKFTHENQVIYLITTTK